MTDGTRVLLVDDEPLARARLRALCSGLPGVAIVGEAADGAAALALVAATAPEVVLLDIAMPGLGGLDVARRLAEAHRPAIVFCTALPDHALAAFEVEAVDYLLKPIGRERLAQAIERAGRRRGMVGGPAQPWLDHLWVPKLGRMVRLRMDDVETIEAEGDYCRFSTAADSYLVHESLGRLESRLDPGRFVRLRRSLIVRTAAIADFTHLGGGAWQASLRDGTEVRIGGTYWKAVKALTRHPHPQDH